MYVRVRKSYLASQSVEVLNIFIHIMNLEKGLCVSELQYTAVQYHFYPLISSARYASVSVYSSTPGDISVTIRGTDCAVTSASNTELECVTGPHTLSDYIFILQFHSRGHQCDYRWCRLCCYISQYH